MVVLNDFKAIHYDCDICPLKNCPNKGFNLLIDCYYDVMQFWKHNGIYPDTGYLQVLDALEEFVIKEDVEEIRQNFYKGG